LAEIGRNKKKRHHYVPACYSRNFAGADGFLRVHQKFQISKSFRQVPSEFGYKKGYHNQIDLDGNVDRNTMEDFFSGYEERWTPFVRCLEQSTDKCEGLSVLLDFMALMKCRSPATREACEYILRIKVEDVSRRMERLGKFGKRPKELEGVEIVASIDPQKSLEMMRETIEAIEKWASILRFHVLRNLSNEKIISSDNAVVSYDRSHPELSRRPYDLNPERIRFDPVFYFPISSAYMLVGERGADGPNVNDMLEIRNMKNGRHVKTLNAQTAKFGYRSIYGPSDKSLQVPDHAMLASPVPFKTTIPHPNGECHHFGFRFGDLPYLPKFS
jgi:hypothetical protein